MIVRRPDIARRCLHSIRRYSSSASGGAPPSGLSLGRVAAVVGVPAALAYLAWSEWTRDERLEAQVFTNQSFITRYRQPTPENPKNVREDTWPVVSRAEAERILKRAERSTEVEREGNIVKRIDTASIAANSPIEDREAEAIIPGPAGDSSFFAVFDGHSGFRTSHLLSRTLLPSLALALAPPPPTSSPAAPPSILSFAGLSHALRSLFPSTTPLPQSSLTVTQRTAQTLAATFLALDASIVRSPLALLPNAAEHKASGFGWAALQPALSGSCALVAYLPPAQDNLYLALAGDCRGVAGYYLPPPAGSPEGAEGKWRVRVLTEDQTGRSAKEEARLRAEHPGEEVVRRGRVLGGLEPSRAFGDARYKWTKDEQERLYDAFLPEVVDGKQPRPVPPASRTPPYVTARPEVTCVPVKDATEEGSGELRFLVLATDGLYDRLSNEAIVGLVGHYLTHPTSHGAIPKSAVLSSVISAGAGEGFDGKKDTVKARKEGSDAEGGFVFGRDGNAATLLVRNSLAGSDEKHMRELLSVKTPITRYMRDDTTVKVVFFNERPAPREVCSGRERSWLDLFWRPAEDA